MTFSKRIRALPREYLSPPRTLPSAFLPLLIHITFTERPKMSHSVYMIAPFSAQKHTTSSSYVLPLLSFGLKNDFKIRHGNARRAGHSKISMPHTYVWEEQLETKSPSSSTTALPKHQNARTCSMMAAPFSALPSSNSIHPMFLL
jgi:hypothetical protein